VKHSPQQILTISPHSSDCRASDCETETETETEKMVLTALPSIDQYVLNPENNELVEPDFTVADDEYV